MFMVNEGLEVSVMKQITKNLLEVHETGWHRVRDEDIIEEVEKLLERIPRPCVYQENPNGKRYVIQARENNKSRYFTLSRNSAIDDHHLVYPMADRKLWNLIEERVVFDRNLGIKLMYGS